VRLMEQEAQLNLRMVQNDDDRAATPYPGTEINPAGRGPGWVPGGTADLAKQRGASRFWLRWWWPYMGEIFPGAARSRRARVQRS